MLETCLVLLVGSTELCAYTSSTFHEYKTVHNGRHSIGSSLEYSLPQTLHWHPSSFRREMRFPIRTLCLIALIASVTWSELKRYVRWSEDTLSIRGVWHPSRCTTEMLCQKGISMGRGYKMQSCFLVTSWLNAEDQPAFIYRVKSLFVRLLMQRQHSPFVWH